MFRNLLAAIFLLALALPATATPAPQSASQMQDCHGMPMEKGKTDPADSGKMLQHGCIGCIAPYAPDIAMTAFEPLPFVTIAQMIHTMDGTMPPPSTPPPRG